MHYAPINTVILYDYLTIYHSFVVILIYTITILFYKEKSFSYFLLLIANTQWSVNQLKLSTKMLQKCSKKGDSFNPSFKNLIIFHYLPCICINPLNANPIKWSNKLKQFVGNSRLIVWVCLTILWGWHLKG